MAAEHRVLRSAQDVKPADFTFDGSSTFTPGVGVQTSQIQTPSTLTSTPTILISLQLAVVDNPAADTMVKTVRQGRSSLATSNGPRSQLKTVVKDGILEKAMHDEGLTGTSGSPPPRGPMTLLVQA